MIRERILVAGGAGFIGSHLCESLLRQGADVLCLDNLFSGSRRNILPLTEHPYFEFIRHDVTQPILLEVDRIYNLASPAAPVHYQYNPVKTVKTNVMGTRARRTRTFAPTGSGPGSSRPVLRRSTETPWSIPSGRTTGAT